MGSHCPFGHLKHKLSKEKPIVKQPVWLSTTKSQNRPDFLACKRRATYHWKALDKGYNFALDLIAIAGLHAKLCTPKIVKVPTVGISGLPLGSLETKNHLDVVPMERHRVYYTGKVVASPKSGLWWILCVQIAHGSS
jgi:hypothetical protein